MRRRMLVACIRFVVAPGSCVGSASSSHRFGSSASFLEEDRDATRSGPLEALSGRHRRCLHGCSTRRGRRHKHMWTSGPRTESSECMCTCPTSWRRCAVGQGNQELNVHTKRGKTTWRFQGVVHSASLLAPHPRRWSPQRMVVARRERRSPAVEHSGRCTFLAPTGVTERQIECSARPKVARVMATDRPISRRADRPTVRPSVPDCPAGRRLRRHDGGRGCSF